ncbi:CaiB/BaiF CoA transferase family protein [Saccharopolyspora flava]|uniref:Crotonobetainyl-CoA:carnitine CoA-transferase CaiB n=1 Tax=Saccharopolyspora flava TaxID=95161 RepID=A0A1I6UFZ3_9PSEU|nr:CoA transferase [Saccharopolyspora flava]SFT00360.1 Crotonobetainyl-CoA:carnitine CoA-transferase CaiB [Saccharopolyspora flava]
MHPTPGALAGLRVIDLTTVIMGPFATATLADLGADVVKVESLDGDMTRSIGARRHEGMSALTLNLQRNKRSIAVDLNTEDGRTVLDDLVRSADVLVTNLRPRSREKLGITFERLSQINPGLILCTAQAYGSETASRDNPAYDDIVQAASGAAKLSELIDGEPRYAPYVIADKVVGLYIVIAVLSAAMTKRKTGVGQAVDVPMVDSMIAFNLVEHFAGRTFTPAEGDFGWARVLTPERVPHQTADGWICILPYSSKNWDDFFTAAGRQDLVGNPRYATVNARHRHMGELLTAVREVASERTTDEWLALCELHGIPASDLLDLGKAAENPYVLGQELITKREHPTEGEYYATRTPFAMSRTPVALHRHAPLLGENTVELLTGLGYTEDDIRALVDVGVVKTASPEAASA